MRKFFPYNLLSTQVIELEEHKVVGGKIRLDHIPKEGSLTVRGFVEAQSAANLQSNEFFCSYRADTQYREANRIVQFYAGRSGQTVYCSYIAIGTVVTADDMNEIGDFMTNANKTFDNNKISLAELKNLLADARNEARTSLAAHNADLAAHADIRDSITKLRKENTDAHVYINARITTVENELRQHKTDETAAIAQAVAAHNVDTAAHSDLRSSVNNLQTDLFYANDKIHALSSAIDRVNSALDTNLEMLNTDIAALEGEFKATFDIPRETFLEYVFDGTGGASSTEAFTQADLEDIFIDD